jgi:[protein-PII] uridylyltransferase
MALKTSSFVHGSEPLSFLQRLTGQLWEKVRSRSSGREISRFLSNEVDRFILSVVQETLNNKEEGSSFPTFALCAVGGYGRREQHPQSDVDLIFLYQQNPARIEGIAQKILYQLWDSRLTIGHAVRTVEECLDLARKDLTIRTNLLDIRFLFGDEGFFLSAKKTLLHRLFWEHPLPFVEGKLEELRMRRERYGDTAFLLEPNLKESPGTLRDLHTLLWVGKAIFRIDELRDLYRKGVLERALVELLERGYDYLLYLRTLVHLFGIEHGSRGDRLTLELQDLIAPFLYYEDSPSEFASEKFMRDTYEITRGIRRGVDVGLERLIHSIRPRSFSALFSRKRPISEGFYIYRGELHGRIGELDRHPHRLIEAFALKARHRVPFSYDLARAIEQRTSLLRFIGEEERIYATNWFREIFTHESQVFTVISEMNEFKVLGEFLPPFRHIYCRVQRDTYHTYTVDQHLLFSLKNFYDLRLKKRESDEPELTSLSLSVLNPFLTALAILTHDIGKGYGVDHSLKGAELGEAIGKKLSLHEEEIANLTFLIRHHLLLTHAMQRRDISDPDVLRDLCRTIQDVERLKMLVLMTYCDLKGVGGEVWNEWKRSLLLTLYDDLRVILEQGDIAGLHRDRITQNKESLKAELLRTHPLSHVERFLEGIPPSFFLRHRGELGPLAFRCVHSAFQTGFGIEVSPGPDSMWWVLMAGRDRPGLLSLFAGILFMGNFSIMEAEGYVLKGEGFALNLFLVIHKDPIFFEIPERKEGFIRLATEVVEGVRPFVPPPAPPSVRPRSRRRVRVQINDHLSRDFTVVEVFCWDRPGLLYQLTDVFFRHGCTIHLARIHTEGQRVSDTFYVQDVGGGKIPSDKQAKIIEDLLRIARST